MTPRRFIAAGWTLTAAAAGMLVLDVLTGSAFWPINLFTIAAAAVAITYGRKGARDLARVEAQIRRDQLHEHVQRAACLHEQQREKAGLS